VTALAYFALTFALSWGGVLLVIGGPGAVPGSPHEIETLFPFVYLAMLVGPPVTGVLLTGLVHGRHGLRDLRLRMLAWQAPGRAYAIALLSAPLAVLLVLLGLSLVDPAFLPGIFRTPDKAGAIGFGVVVALGAGFFEELGWTGFAIPELRRRCGVFATGVMVGVLWGLWHFLAVAWGIGDRTGGIPLALFVLLDGLAVLPVYRVLMVWLYDRTGSLFVAMVMHASLTASLIVLGPQVSGVRLLIFDLVLAGTLWAVVLAAVRGAGLPHSPRLRRTVLARFDSVASGGWSDPPNQSRV
jgi:CAAX protease family protein